MKISTAVWGPLFWTTISIVCLGYPKKPTYGDKKAMKEFFESLQYLLPCGKCREHYKQLLVKHPITPHIDRRDDIFKYSVMLHNEVNKSLNKPTMTEVEALLYIKRLGERDTSPIITREMFEEIDMRSMMKGALIGGGLVVLLGTGIYFFSKESR